MHRFLIFLICCACTSQSEKKQAPYGTWPSPITAENIAKGACMTLDMIIDGEETYINEMRPTNQGRNTIVYRNVSGFFEDITPPDFNVRTSVHEYGGAAFTVAQGIVYASSGDDNAIYVFEKNKKPYRLTDGKTRFAEMHLTPYGIVAVGEQPDIKVENFLALINIKDGTWKKLASGNDFYSSPAISKDGKKIAWITWNHPDMPWTNTQLWTGEFDEKGGLTSVRQIGLGYEESFFQPQWSPNGTLYFVTDRNSGWWNIHRYINGQIENVCPIEAEVAEPLWNLGLSTYAFIGENIVFTYNSLGRWRLAFLNTTTKQWEKIKRPSTLINQVRAGNGFVQFLEQYPNSGEGLVRINSDQTIQTLSSFDLVFDQGYVSLPEHISFLSEGRMSYGFYYPPKNLHYTGPKNEKPPLIVMIHGGPTWQATGTFQLEKQFWTTRGFAVLDVNYGGSTGYGKAYRNLLDQQWGVVDIEDCVNGACFLASRGLIDKDKMAIRGKSSGGYTTLAALAFKNVFKAGGNYFGVADLTAFARDTHKFEQYYLEQLIGKREVWEARSPIHAVQNIRVPLIIFQGQEDPIVSKNQSIMIYDALKKQNLMTELYLYPHEQHGFRQEEVIADSLNRELNFYLKVFIQSVNQKSVFGLHESFRG